MSGFTNADGSGLVGGLTPAGNGQALKVDASGNLLVTGTSGGGSLTIADPTTPANKAAVDVTGALKVNATFGAASVGISDGTTSSQKLSVDASGKIGINNFPSTQPVSGSVSVSNFPTTQPVSGSISVSNLPATQASNITQLNGSGLSISNPFITEDQLRAWIVSGQGFSGTTGKLNAGAAITAAFSLFNPAGSGKNVLLYSLRLFYVGATAIHQAQLTTSDPAFGNAAVVGNNKAGGATSAIASNVTYANSNQGTLAGNAYDVIAASGGVTLEMFVNGSILLFPTGSGNGLAVYLGIPSANNWAVTARWIEF